MNYNDNDTLRLLYALAGQQSYDPRKWFTTSSSFVSSFPKEKQLPFIIEQPFKQINVPEKHLYKYAGPKRLRR
jgi:hypothetical protein